MAKVLDELERVCKPLSLGVRPDPLALADRDRRAKPAAWHVRARSATIKLTAPEENFSRGCRYHVGEVPAEAVAHPGRIGGACEFVSMGGPAA